MSKHAQKGQVVLPVAIAEAPQWKPAAPGQRQRPRPTRGQLRMVFDRSALHRNRRTRDVAPLVVARDARVRLHVVSGGAAGRIEWPDDYDMALRPRYRWQCADVPRPCPYVGCQHHLYLDVEQDGSLRLNFPDVEPDELKWDCAADLAEDGMAHGAELAKRLNLSREEGRKKLLAAVKRFAETWEKQTGEHAPLLNMTENERRDAPEPEVMGEIGDIEWDT